MAFYELNVAEEPVSLAVLGFNVRHRVVAQADVRPNGEDTVTVHAALSQSAGGWPWSPSRRAMRDTRP